MCARLLLQSIIKDDRMFDKNVFDRGIDKTREWLCQLSVMAELIARASVRIKDLSASYKRLHSVAPFSLIPTFLSGPVTNNRKTR